MNEPMPDAALGTLALPQAQWPAGEELLIGRWQLGEVLVRVDIGAMTKLRGRGFSDASAKDLLYAHREELRLAAQNLLRTGFWTSVEDRHEVLVTALELY